MEELQDDGGLPIALVFLLQVRHCHCPFLLFVVLLPLSFALSFASHCLVLVLVFLLQTVGLVSGYHPAVGGTAIPPALLPPPHRLPCPGPRVLRAARANRFSTPRREPMPGRARHVSVPPPNPDSSGASAGTASRP